MKKELKTPIYFSKLLSANLILSLYLIFNISTLAITREQCNAEFQLKVNELLNDDDNSARELSEKILGESFQKLAYAHNLFADGSEKDLQEYENKLDKYIKENYKYSMSASDVMKHLKEFSTPFQNAINKKHSSSAGATNSTREKLQALTLFSRSLDDKKFHIQDYEKDALSKFNFKAHGRDVDGWGLFVGDVARNFYQRRFYNEQGQKDNRDKDFSKAKVSDYNKEVKEAIKAVKNDILQMAKGMSKECRDILKELGHSSGLCSLTNPFDIPTHDLILDAEGILSKINDPDATFIERPISVHYTGAQFNIQECAITESKNKPGTYKVKMKMDFEYIPGADSEDWSMSLFGGVDGHTHQIINDDDYFNDLNSNKALKTFTRSIEFDQVSFPDNNIKSPLELNFNNKTGGQVKMWVIGKNPHVRDLTGSGSKYSINCSPDVEPVASAPAPSPAKKEIYSFKVDNNKNDITLSLFKDDTPASFESNELKGSKVEWSLPEGITCEENAKDEQNLNCKITKEITEATKVGYALVDHSILPDKAEAPKKGEVDLIVKSTTPVSINVTKKNIIDKQETKLTAIVTGAGDNPEITWTIKPKTADGDEEKIKASSINVGMFDTITYKVTSSGKEISGEHSNKLSLSVKPDGKNSTKEKDVKLIASIKEKEFQGLKGTFGWKCDGKPCGGAENKLSTKRKDKTFSVVATFKAGNKLFESGPVKIKPLSKDKDKKKIKDNECEEDEDEDSDPFSTKKVKDCTPKVEKKVFAPKYMPSMQQPIVLPASQPYITPGFN